MTYGNPRRANVVLVHGGFVDFSPASPSLAPRGGGLGDRKVSAGHTAFAGPEQEPGTCR